MARPYRREVEDGLFHVYARGNGKLAIYLDDADRLSYLRMLALAVKKTGWRCLAYCLMDNHVHLVVETPDTNLAPGMQWLHGVYAQTFNERHGRAGHVFQGRYGATQITTDSQLWTVVRYLALNPVEAGLCSRPEEWRWGSYGASHTGSPAWLNETRLLDLLSGSGGDPRRRYLEFVEDGLH
jgi:putative transposase